MTLFVLSPPIATGDVIDATTDVVTNKGNAVTFTQTGSFIDGFTGTFSSDPLEKFYMRLFDNSEGDWHVQSGDYGMWVFVNSGTVRALNSTSLLLQTPRRRRVLIGGRA